MLIVLNLKLFQKFNFSNLKRVFPSFKVKGLFLSSLCIFTTALLILLTYNVLFFRKIYPGVSIAEIPVSGLDKERTVKLLSEKVIPPEKITIFEEGAVFEIDLASINLSYSFQASVESAYGLYRSGNIFSDLYNRLLAPFKKFNLKLKTNLNKERLWEYLLIISDQVAQEPIYPSAKLFNGNVLVERGSPGKKLDLEKLNNTILFNLSSAKYEPISIPTQPIDPTLSEEEAEVFKERAEKFIDKNFSLYHESQVFTFNESGVFLLLDPKNGYKEEEILLLISSVAKNVNREPQNAVFVFLPAGKAGKEDRVEEFAPAKDGLIVNELLLKEKIIESLEMLETDKEKSVSIEIPVNTTPPRITTEEVNNLGIKELIGRGSSHFRGSISSRIHNIGVASSKFNGVLIAPNEIFSFNKTLGDVSVYTGYKQAYIIKEGRTVLGDGGGVCQVSTTLFRAVLDASLPIIERRAHSYRVYYYEQDSSPGLDATVYDPTTDLKFKNDTPGYLLIQTQFDKNRLNLAFEIYGTSDGRTVKITKPVITDVTPPPEDLYLDDPSLPQGEVKQIDWKAWGAKVWFDYKVERDEEIIYEKTFYSNYRPWQAVYLRGAGPAQ